MTTLVNHQGDSMGDRRGQSRAAEQRAALGTRFTPGILSTVLGVWMLFCAGLAAVDAFESFSDTRAVSAIVFALGLATLSIGIARLSVARKSRGLDLLFAGVVGASVVGSLLMFNAYGPLLVLPVLLLGLPSILVVLYEARKPEFV